jgi:outer membrane protein, multidrug efflux system
MPLSRVRVRSLLLILLLGGCNFAPPYERPVAPIVTTYSEPSVAGGRLATEVEWRNFFGDPQLKAYIAAALENNRDLMAATARIAQAQAVFRIQNAQRLPELDIGASANRARAPTPAGGVTSNLFATQVSIPPYELDFWGRLANLSEAARRQYFASIDAQRAFRLSLISSVASTYYAVRSGEEGIDLSARTLVTRRHVQEIAKARLDAGVTSAVDYDQTAVLVTQAETQLASLQLTTDQSRHLLTVLVGGPIAGPLPPGRGTADADQFAALEPGLPSSLLINRPDVQAAEEQLRAAYANIGAARATYFPFISLTGAYGYVSPELSNLFRGASRTWTFGAAATLPLIDWGRRRATVALAKGVRDELVANYQTAVEQAFRQVADGLSGRRDLDAQIRAQERAVAAQQDLSDTAELRYESGVSIYLEVLDAERSLFIAQQQLIALRAQALQNGVALYTALGGGAG